MWKAKDFHGKLLLYRFAARLVFSCTQRAATERRNRLNKTGFNKKPHMNETRRAFVHTVENPKYFSSVLIQCLRRTDSACTRRSRTSFFCNFHITLIKTTIYKGANLIEVFLVSTNNYVFIILFNPRTLLRKLCGNTWVCNLVCLRQTDYVY